MTVTRPEAGHSGQSSRAGFSTAALLESGRKGAPLGAPLPFRPLDGSILLASRDRPDPPRPAPSPTTSFQERDDPVDREVFAGSPDQVQPAREMRCFEHDRGGSAGGNEVLQQRRHSPAQDVEHLHGYVLVA